MEEFQQREWYELRSNTWNLLRRREHILHSKHRPLFQYLVMPSFDDTWCIDIVRTGNVLAAFHTVWRVTQDINVFATAIERLKHPRHFTPTLISNRLAIDDDDLKALLDRLECIQIRLRLTPTVISTDGVSFELQVGDGSAGVTLRWHNELPSEWPNELRDIVGILAVAESQDST